MCATAGLPRMSYSPAWPAHCTLRGYADYLLVLPNADDKTAQTDRGPPVTIHVITARRRLGRLGARVNPVTPGFEHETVNDCKAIKKVRLWACRQIA